MSMMSNSNCWLELPNEEVLRGLLSKNIDSELYEDCFHDMDPKSDHPQMLGFESSSIFRDRVWVSAGILRDMTGVTSHTLRGRHWKLSIMCKVRFVLGVP